MLSNRALNALTQSCQNFSTFASVYQAAKLVAALLRVAEVTAGLAENNGSRVYDSRHLQAECQEPGSAPELEVCGNRFFVPIPSHFNDIISIPITFPFPSEA